MPANASFLADPYDFCTRYALHPQDIQGGVGGRKPGNYFSVPSGERVKWCQIVDGATLPYGFKVGANSGCYSAKVQAAPPAPVDAANWFPVYFLPWAANETFRITLKNRQGGVPDPDIFITSAVDGCSVFIEGDPAEPTVYHANIASGQPPGKDASLEDWEAYYDPKRLTMEDRINQTRSPKSVQQNPALARTAPPKSVNATEYMDLVQSRRDHYEAAPRKTLAALDVKAENPGLKKIRITGTDYKPCGTVFGWRQGGLWTFYYQRRAIMYYTWSAKRKGFKGAFQGRQTNNPPLCREYPLSCTEFYPNGAGRMFARRLKHDDPHIDWLQDFNL